MFETPNNRPKKPENIRKIIGADSILPEHLEWIKFIAESKSPLSISRWDKYTQAGEEVLAQLIIDYDLPVSDDGKVNPVEIPNVDLKLQAAIIAEHMKEIWRNRKN